MVDVVEGVIVIDINGKSNITNTHTANRSSVSVTKSNITTRVCAKSKIKTRGIRMSANISTIKNICDWACWSD